MTDDDAVKRVIDLLTDGGMAADQAEMLAGAMLDARKVVTVGVHGDDK